jgi:prepilin-type N-terminal cleavage/methylation domain-containing protein
VKKKGFTLIELLVVIAIIGILTTIALVSFTSARQKANFIKVTVEMKQLSSQYYLLQDEGLSASAVTAEILDSNIADSINGNSIVGNELICVSGGSDSAICFVGVTQPEGQYLCIDLPSGFINESPLNNGPDGLGTMLGGNCPGI